MTAPAPAPAPAVPTTDEMLDAIKTVRLAQAEKIGALCVASAKSGTALTAADVLPVTEILAGLDLAAQTLAAGL